MAGVTTSTIVSGSVQETLDLGRRLGRSLAPGAVLALIGPLGGGKTQLAKGIAQGCGVPESVIVSSPTFVLVHEYPGRLPVFHLDAYRLSGPADLAALGFDEMIDGGGAVLVEWADRVEACLPADHLRIEIDIAGEAERHIRLTAAGPHATALMAAGGRT
jgi:tRNA threonylcarbamoyladenosine biosynthesis protein TsaE